MSHRTRVALFIAVDLIVLLSLLLLLSYYGLSHLAMLAMGLLFLMLTLYDLQSGVLSQFFSEFLGLAGPGELNRLKWVPVMLSTLLLVLSLPVFLEHGLVNTTQRWVLQQGQFLRLALIAAGGAAAVIFIAVLTIFKGGKKED